MNIQATGPSSSQMILNVSSAPQQSSYSSTLPAMASSSQQSSSADAHKIPVRSTGNVVQRLPPSVVYAPVASSSNAHRQPSRDMIQKRIVGHVQRSPRLPKNKSYQKRRHTLPHRLEELRKALDLTKYIEQVQNLINQPIKIPSTVSTCMNKKARKVPSKPKHDLLSIKDVWGTDEQRRSELKTMFNTENVGEREFLLNLLLDESDEESDTEDNITEQDLQQMLKIHRKRRKCQNNYHKDPLYSQYTYYAAGLLSEQDKFTENQQTMTNDDVTLQIARDLVDSTNPLNVESLLDAVIAIYHDCNLPALKRIHNVAMFLTKFGPLVKSLIDNRMKTSDFRMIKVIGRGACGEVQLVRHLKTQKVFALKRLEKAEVIRRIDFSFFWEEKEIMTRSASDWIVKMFYSFQDHRYLFMAMEFMPGGDLVNLMSREEISEEWARFYIAELVLALEAVHTLGYIHRDVKPDNMLISGTGHVKLADFGTCVKLNPEGKIKCATAAGTPDYISPEVLNSQCSESTYGVEVDYWSVGIILYEMLYGEPPFYADTLVKTYSRIQNFDTELKFPSDVTVSDETKDIIRRFLSAASIRLGRNGSAEVKEHPFFRNNKWTFDNICQATPPFVPALSTDDDTSNFEDIDPPEHTQPESLIPQAFNGSQLPFVGFTFSNDLNPALKLEIASDKKEPIQPEVRQCVENGVQVCFEEEIIMINGNGTHLTNGIKESPIVNGVNEKILIDVVKEQIVIDENLQLAIDNKQEEICSLMQQKCTLEHGMQKLQNDKSLFEFRFNTLREEHSTAQNLINVYKAELDELRNQHNESDRQRNHFDDLLESLRDAENKLRSEQIARRIADQNVAELDKEKNLLKVELRDMVDRNKEDGKLIQVLRQREAELLEALRREETMRSSNHSNRPNTGPVIHHHSDRSSDSISVNNISGSRTSLHDLDGLSRDQLISRCKREIALKENAIEKLLIMGTSKGIESEKSINRSKSTKKQRVDINRQREMWNQEHAVEMKRMREMEIKKDKEIDFYRAQLQDAMLKVGSLTHEHHELDRQLKEIQAVLGPDLKPLMNGIAAGHVQSKKKQRPYR
ncbi:Non-specific serine/threonine protein kinase [Aphelenchoides bicaudatus]|nr:Non-specific serine/threonine protein kinase [Aphelenchoides bicaudatus]